MVLDFVSVLTIGLTVIEETLVISTGFSGHQGRIKRLRSKAAELYFMANSPNPDPLGPKVTHHRADVHEDDAAHQQGRPKFHRLVDAKEA